MTNFTTATMQTMHLKNVVGVFFMEFVYDTLRSIAGILLSSVAEMMKALSCGKLSRAIFRQYVLGCCFYHTSYEIKRTNKIPNTYTSLS